MTTPTTFWRLAGVSYVQYVNKASSTLRMALREPAKSKAVAQETFAYNRSQWTEGAQGPKTMVGKFSK
eukprot:CAMPEP_0172549882 /NCGR_PEP_ID=MMETSP1067-20121228/22576_1 /TAXON_ID=265564 ORGANISM="Thalassiosira punctigera, Strain Tpunct2005C2" /NCGR_SAMPLE_ID=MMETSP1067 /ASSEMBLY_ACC=CAM_ASM_000444 /LENGTH=67 /DNA_ID=CAMNT_0013337323 /DNA_START=84 /DNA_END=287 /DNA_ORIENTATION=+